MMGVIIAQLYRLQHSPAPDPVFGYYALSKPIAGILQGSAAAMVFVGAIRYWRQQQAMALGKVHAGGWELTTIMGFTFLVSCHFHFECLSLDDVACMVGWESLRKGDGELMMIIVDRLVDVDIVRDARRSGHLSWD